MNSSPEKRTKSIRPELAHQCRPTYAIPTTSHSAIGKCRIISNPVSLRPVFLNIPLAPLPNLGAGRRGPGELLSALPARLDRQQQVDEAGEDVATYLSSGGEPGRLLAVLGGLLVREDRNFHTIQCVEAAFRQYDRRRADGLVLRRMMKDVTGLAPDMWGPSIIGFGDDHYRYTSGREGDFFLVGFSPRKQSLSLYIPSGFPEYNALGKHKKGASCLYINKLADIDLAVLRKLIARGFEHARSRNG